MPGVILGLEQGEGGGNIPEVQCQKDRLLLEYKAKVYMGGSVSDRKREHPEVDSSDS